MSLYSDRDLARIRGKLAAWLPDSCIIYAVGKQSTSNGVTKTRTARGGAVPCRFATLTGVEAERAEQLAAEADTTLTLAYDAVIEGTDEVDVTQAETGRVLTLQVKHVVRRSQELQHRVYTQNLNP